MEWIYRSAGELADQIATGEVSSVEVTDAHTRRIEAVNLRLNALVVPLFDQARVAARKADEARAKGQPLGPLHGVPITIKECHDVAGARSSAGLPGLLGHRAAQDMLMVARLRSAGAVVLGKTNAPQLMLYFESDNPVYGQSNNPWDLERTPGGSSGGEAAIIAAGGSPLGLGSDIGGSIRIPAHFTGICGLMPTARRLTEHGSADLLIAPGMDGLVCQPGPMARHVRDLNLVHPRLARLCACLPEFSVPMARLGRNPCWRMAQLTGALPLWLTWPKCQARFVQPWAVGLERLGKGVCKRPCAESAHFRRGPIGR